MRTIGDVSIQGVDSHFGAWSAALRFDTLDSYNFPTTGSAGELFWLRSIANLSTDTEFEIAHALGYKAISIGRHVGVGIARGGTVLRGDSVVSDAFSLGGLYGLSGYSPAALTGNHYCLAALIYAYQLYGGKGRLIDVPIYIGASAEIGNIWKRRKDVEFKRSLITAGSAWVGLDTLVGPAYLSYGFAEGGEHSVMLLFGTPFRN